MYAFVVRNNITLCENTFYCPDTIRRNPNVSSAEDAGSAVCKCAVNDLTERARVRNARHPYRPVPPTPPPPKPFYLNVYIGARTCRRANPSDLRRRVRAECHPPRCRSTGLAYFFFYYRRRLHFPMRRKIVELLRTTEGSVSSPEKYPAFRE